MKYKAIGFDYGGVIYGVPGSVFMQGAAELLGVSKAKLDKAYFQHNHHANVQGGSWDAVWERTLHELNLKEKLEAFIAFQKEKETIKKINPEIIELIHMIRQRGYKIGMLSNYSSDLRVKLEEQKLLQYFDAVGISSEMGCMKPAPEAFQKFSEMLDVEPSELIYIDDTEKSLESAQTVGYTPILFESYKGLVRELKRLEVLPDLQE